MSAFLVFQFLIGTAVVVWSACFIGCDRVFGLTHFDPYGGYQDTVTSTAGLVAFWPLNDTSGTTAADLAAKCLNGTYTMGPVITAYNPRQQAHPSPGTFERDHTYLVDGDTVNGDRDYSN